VRLETGSVVPADCRIVESVNLRVQEAALTGESEPIEKVAAAIALEDLAARRSPQHGLHGDVRQLRPRRGAGGRDRQCAPNSGKIATMIQSVVHEPTPLQKKLDRLGKTLAIIAVAVAAAVAWIGLLVEARPGRGADHRHRDCGGDRPGGAAGRADVRARHRRPAHGPAQCTDPELPAVETWVVTVILTRTRPAP